ncbi:MAG: hypothetical protein LBF38_04785 [Deltaproteobacteria bacterium]|jgi:hypothetical protein|nr:hypothetical protein [Deltaproteobacteria bacterium]
MPRTIIAQTNEVDDAQVAVEDLLTQLAPDTNLSANSVGFIFGDTTVLDPDLLPALSESVNFDIVGVNSNVSAGPLHKKEFSYLTLMVLTGEDIRISTALSEDFGQINHEAIIDLYRSAASKLDNPPKLAYLLGSRQSSVFHPDRLVTSLNTVVGDCPVFGALGCDLESILKHGCLIHNGQKYMNRAALVLFDGPIKPKFSIYKLPENKFLKRKAIVTSCTENVIEEINGIPAIAYLATLGLVIDKEMDFSYTVPLIVEHPDAGYWEPILILKQKSGGHVICTRDIRKNSTLGLAGYDEFDVIKSAADLAEELRWEAFDFCLIHSCQGRHISLGLDYMAEINRFRNILSQMTPYSLSYTGGEICPRIGDQKGPPNGFHSLSLTCCRF